MEDMERRNAMQIHADGLPRREAVGEDAGGDEGARVEATLVPAAELGIAPGGGPVEFSLARTSID